MNMCGPRPIVVLCCLAMAALQPGHAAFEGQSHPTAGLWCIACASRCFGFPVRCCSPASSTHQSPVVIPAIEEHQCHGHSSCRLYAANGNLGNKPPLLKLVPAVPSCHCFVLSDMLVNNILPIQFSVNHGRSCINTSNGFASCVSQANLAVAGFMAGRFCNPLLGLTLLASLAQVSAQ